MLAQFFNNTLLVLTHRRGAAVLLLRGQDAVSIQDVKSAVLDSVVSEKFDGFGMATWKDAALALSFSTTAEVLRSMYLKVLEHQALKDEHIENIIFGEGPGSFTGLRLGAAFLNGLALGRPRKLWQVPCPLRKDVLEHFEKQSFVNDDLKVVFEGFKDGDEFDHHVNVFDVALVLENAVMAKAVSVLVPEYGRLPGPVLKLAFQKPKQ